MRLELRGVYIALLPHDVIKSFKPNVSPYEIKGSGFDPAFVITSIDIYNPAYSNGEVNLTIDDTYSFVIPINTNKGFTNGIFNDINYTGPTSGVVITIMGISYPILRAYGVIA